MEVNIVAISDAVIEDERSLSWRVNALPAYLSCLLENSRNNWPVGWVIVRMHLNRQCSGYESRLILTFSSSKTRVIDLPVTLKGNIFQVVYFPPDIQEIHFEPMTSLGRFQIDDFEVIKISWIVRHYLMLRRLYHTYRSQPCEVLYKMGLRWYMLVLQLDKAYQLTSSIRGYSPKIPYDKWISRYDDIDHHDEQKIAKKIRRGGNLPRLNVVYLGEDGPEFLSLQVKLQHTQLYLNYNLILKADFVDRALNYKWIVFIEPGVTLRPHALFWLAYEINKQSNTAFIYSDHDYLDAAGQRYSPQFKPQWSPEFFFASNYIGKVVAIKSGVINFSKLIHWRIFEIVMSFIDKTQMLSQQGLEVIRIPNILFHVSDLQESVEQKHLLENQETLKYYFTDRLIEVQIDSYYEHYTKLLYEVIDPSLVSIIIPTRDMLHHLQRCVDCLLEKTLYQNFEILIVDNQSIEDETLIYLDKISQHLQVRVISYDEPFNYSAINNYAADFAKGEVLCLLNNDTEVISPDWLNVMLGQLQQPNVGVVGTKLLFKNGKVQHAGDAVGPGGCADHFHSGIDADEPGYMGRAILAHDLSAVTAACLLTTHKLFDQLNGLDESNLSVAFNDVDYCLRVREHGFRVVFTPYITMYHHESVSRGKDETPEKKARAKKEADYMRKRWSYVIKNDPFYNPNLNYLRPDFELNQFPLVKKPW